MHRDQGINNFHHKNVMFHTPLEMDILFVTDH